jgi:iron complex outermembrane receptor protein
MEYRDIFMAIKKHKFIFFILTLFIINPVFAQEAQILEKITVKRSKSGFFQESVGQEEFRQKALGAPAEALSYFSGVDLRSRAAFGIQSDLSLRGSTYEQVAVLIDGIRVMDPQTGHYNLDIPLTNFDIEEVEVIKNAASSLYGNGAFAGGVNFITKKPTRETLSLEALFGQHALFGQAFSYSLPLKNNFSTRISFDHKVAKAARPNTDFEYQTGSFYLNKDFVSSSLSTLVGWQKKDYGADSFYSNLFPEEEEHTQTLFTNTSLDSQLGEVKLKNNLYLRRHRDKFILNRNNPTSVNYHTTYIYGLNSGFEIPVKFGSFSLGLDAGRDQINSTNLGKHTRLYEAGLLGANLQLGDKIDTDIRLRFDHYQKWSWQKSFNLGFGYKIIESLRLKGSFACSFRIPTFTELYYSDAANIGNPNLGVEKSDNFTIGFNFKEGWINLGLEGFMRLGANLIDWTRNTSADVWRATNLGSVDFRGVAFDAKLKPLLNYKSSKLDEIAFSYNYTSADKKTSGFLSKYALDILMHQFTLGVNSGIFGFNLNWQFSYNKRYYGETYFLGSVNIGKKLVKRNFTFEPFLKIENFTNTKYSEVGGVLQPGRWLQAGTRIEW